ncbi:MAG TPA: cation:proton antiporter [Xanthomonadaceae bacterium]|jgi:multicomponent Na+:H+ antiporter subunit C|nr:cation:proton antiporter [Xanthomonadaceae bacterium]
MSLLLLLGVAALTASGIYLLLSRDLLRSVVGLTLLGTAINLVLFISGRIGPALPPIVPEGAQVLVGAANPLPQALVLTAIVIGFALSCIALGLALALREDEGTDRIDELRATEPGEGEDGKPLPMSTESTGPEATETAR